MAEDKDLEQKITLTFGTNADEQAKKVDTLVKSTDNVKEAQAKATQSTRDQKDALNELSPALSGTIEGLKATGKALLTLALNPILLFLTAVVAAFALLGKAFLSNEANSNKLSKGLAVISGLFSGLLKVLEPVASFLVNNIVKSFELAGNAILATSALLQRGLRALGLDGAAAGLKSLTDAVDTNIRSSNKLADAEANLVKAQRLSQKVQLDFQREAEKIRQQRDDETNSIGERVKLNEQLGVVLQKQLNAELSIAKQQKNVSDLRIKQEGESSANLDERAEALTRISDIQERLSGQESEQLANANSLRNEQKSLDKEALAARQVLEDAKKALMQEGVDAERDLLKSIQDLNDKTDQEKLDRQKERDLLEIAEIEKKGIDVRNLLILNNEKFETLQAELEIKNAEEKAERDKIAAEKKLEADKVIADKQKEIDLAVLAQKEAIEDSKLNIANKGIALIAGVFGKSKAIQKAAIIAENAVGIAKMIIDNNRANVGAGATPQAIATSGASAIPVIALNNITTGIGIASSIAATSKALSAVGGGGAGGGGSVPATPRGGAAPQVGFQNSQENQIGTTLAGNINEQPPVQAYVVSSEVTTAQSLDRNRINANSF